MVPVAGFKIGEKVTMMKLGSLVRFTQKSVEEDFA